MTKAKLYAFFVEDDCARSQAYFWCASSSIAAGLLLRATGVSDTISIVCVAVTSLAVILLRVRAYSLTPVARIARRSIPRREALFIATVGFFAAAGRALTVELTLQWGSAFLFAKQAIESTREGTPVSVSKARFYLYLIETRSPQAKSLDHAQIVRAKAELLASATYATVRAVAPQMPVTKERDGFYEKPIVLKGSGNRETVFSFIPSAPSPYLFDFGSDFGLDNLTIETRTGSRFYSPMTLFLSANKSNVFVKNCTIKGFNQDLSAATWIDVDFVECEIRINHYHLSLVNVTFKDCTVECDAMIDKLFPRLSRENFAALTYSTPR